ncbi:unnamed protein product [Mytilus coruscus]|uniref:Uncharacterized protein n=1 Tax=Mytilus coruscus TaxID=42192 RepID=A0A6J8BDS2_MYTCO|nr:unnamed protein product [Mytilus coruscus]
MASLSVEEENYVRMSLLLTGISPRAARTFFDSEFAPACLDATIKKEYNKLLDLKKKHRINQSQWNLLCPRFPEYNIMIQHAKKGGEKKLFINNKCYKVDGYYYDRENKMRNVYEFLDVIGMDVQNVIVLKKYIFYKKEFYTWIQILVFTMMMVLKHVKKVENMMGSKLGDLTDEIVSKHNANHIKQFISAGPKDYSMKLDTEKLVSCCKGFRLNAEVEEKDYIR